MLSLLTCLLFCCISIYAQKREVKGTITDTKGEALIGVTVTVKGDKLIGTVTDFDGRYTLSVPENTKNLDVTYVGMKPAVVPIKGNIVNVVLEDLQSELDELVVIGYGTIKRRDLTGSVSSVQGEALKNIPVSNVAEAMTGKLAGVQITATEGSPDAELKIRVRGGGSITGDNTPLLIVDGFPVESISDIPASEIESIDVLKDASSTAIYGSRGANGVIIVTTKSGKSGKLSVSYNAFLSVKKIAKTLDVLSAKDYAKWQYEYALLANKNDPDTYEKYFGTYQDMDLYDGYQGNDWQDLIYGRTGHVFNHNIGISGGADKFTYAFNYAHVADKAIMIGSDFRRDNISLKLKHNPTKSLTFDYSVRYSNTKIKGGGMNEQNEKSSNDSRMKHSVIYSPIPFKALGDDGSDEEETSSYLINPFTAVNDNDRLQRRRTINLVGGVTWKPISDLSLKSEIGIDHYDAEDSRFYGSTTYYVKNTPLPESQGKPAVIFTDNTRRTIRNTNTANYNFKKLLPNKDHSLSMLIGQENIVRRSSQALNTVHGLPSSFLADDAFYRSTVGKANSVENTVDRDDKLVSFFARGNYDYMSKYLLSATFRADGSSKFARGNRWGYFPSAAVAWRMSSEDFMKNTSDWLDNLKLRLSYGTAGNNNIPTGQMERFFSPSSTTLIDGISSYWSASKRMANPELKWETTYTRNLGVDFGIFNSKLNGSVEVYLNNTKDLLMEFPIPGSGYDFQYRNMGETQNKGIELQLNYNAVNNKNFGLDFSFNIGFNKNKIKDLGVMQDFGRASGWNSEISNDYWVAVGGPVGQMYGYKSAGRYEVSDFEEYNGSEWKLKEGVVNSTNVVGTLRPGMMKLQDIAGDDNVVDDRDRTIIGDANPLHTGGFTINFRAYSFDLSAAFNWSYGNDIYNANKIEYTSTSKYQYRNMTSEMEDGSRWTNLLPNGTITNNAEELAALNANTTMWSPYMKKYVFSDWAVEDGSFLRLNTLTLGYTIPAKFVNKFKVQSLRFYTSAYNVFCLTNYSGADPEVSTRRKTSLTPGVDYSAYPKSRQFTFGVNLTF